MASMMRSAYVCDSCGKNDDGLSKCALCGMHGGERHFSDESNDTCKNCERVCVLKEKVRLLEGKTTEFVRNSFEFLKISGSVFEEDSRDSAENADGSMDHAGAVQKTEGRSPGQSKEQNSDDEAQGVKVGELSEKITEAARHYFVGIYPVEKKQTAEEAFYDCECRTSSHKGVWSGPNHPIDEKAKNEKQLKLFRAFYTKKPLSVGRALGEFSSLKSEHLLKHLCIYSDEKYPALENKTAAIVYLRIYDKQQPSV